MRGFCIARRTKASSLGDREAKVRATGSGMATGLSPSNRQVKDSSRQVPHGTRGHFVFMSL